MCIGIYSDYQCRNKRSSRFQELTAGQFLVTAYIGTLDYLATVQGIEFDDTDMFSAFMLFSFAT